MTVTFEANTSSPLRHTLARAFYPVVRELVRLNAGNKLTKALATFKTFSVKVTDAVRGPSGSTWSQSRAWPFRWVPGRHQRADRRSCGSRAEPSRGLTILIDEAQDLTRDQLKALCAFCHQRAASVAVADGPRGPASCTPRVPSKANGFAEHAFSYREITQLQDGAAGQALTGPAAAEGVAWDEEASGK